MAKMGVVSRPVWQRSLSLRSARTNFSKLTPMKRILTVIGLAVVTTVGAQLLPQQPYFSAPVPVRASWNRHPEDTVTAFRVYWRRVGDDKWLGYHEVAGRETTMAEFTLPTRRATEFTLSALAGALESEAATPVRLPIPAPGDGFVVQLREP